MAIEYSLILAGNASPEELWPRLFPDTIRRPDVTVSGRVWIADLRKSMGFELRVMEGTDGFFGAEALEDYWTWELAHYVNVGFRFDKFFPREGALRHMLKMVAQILATGPEDAALIQNGNQLLLRREAVKLIRFPAQGFWESVAPETVPDALSDG